MFRSFFAAFCLIFTLNHAHAAVVQIPEDAVAHLGLDLPTGTVMTIKPADLKKLEKSRVQKDIGAEIPVFQAHSNRVARRACMIELSSENQSGKIATPQSGKWILINSTVKETLNFFDLLANIPPTGKAYSLDTTWMSTVDQRVTVNLHCGFAEDAIPVNTDEKSNLGIKLPTPSFVADKH